MLEFSVHKVLYLQKMFYQSYKYGQIRLSYLNSATHPWSLELVRNLPKYSSEVEPLLCLYGEDPKAPYSELYS